MSEKLTLDSLGKLGESIKTEIKESVENVLPQMVEPLRILKGFESVEVLTLDEVCQVLRSSKERVREAVRRGELPGNSLGRDIIFPKRLIADYLLGRWRREEKTEKVKVRLSGVDKKINSFVN